MGTRKKEFPPRHMASPLGHSCQFRDARAAAALPPTAAVMLQCRERRDVPRADYWRLAAFLVILVRVPLGLEIGGRSPLPYASFAA